MSTYLLWCDLETTGLDLKEDEIIEAAFILTDSDLNEHGRWHSTFQPSPSGWARLVANEFVRKMHCNNGLVTDIAWIGATTGLPHSRTMFAAGIYADVRKVAGESDFVHLAGSGIAAFDRPLIRRDFDAIETLLHYAPIDVGVLKRTWQMWAGGPITQDEAAKNHRAMSDVEGHLSEARAFREAFKTFAEQS